MANPELQAVIDALIVDIDETTGVEESAIVFINGVNQIIAALRAQLEALAATPEQLAAIVAAGVALDAKKDELAAALAANP
jgi:hypothetical protein